MEERIPVLVDFDWLLRNIKQGSFDPKRLRGGIFFFQETKEQVKSRLNSQFPYSEISIALKQAEEVSLEIGRASCRERV